MAAIAFDTLKFARRLKEVGVPEAQAEAQAELMAEAFVFNMDALVTKDYLEQCLDARFAVQDAHLDRIDQFIVEQKACNQRLEDHLRGHEQRFNHIDVALVGISGELKLLRWMLALIVITTVIPVLQGWFTRFVLGG
jgi:uncharacterized coiled-coil protein SlyX